MISTIKNAVHSGICARLFSSLEILFLFFCGVFRGGGSRLGRGGGG